MFFEDNIDDNKYSGHLYGLGTSYVQNGGGFESVNHFMGNSHSSTPPAQSTGNNSNVANSTNDTSSSVQVTSSWGDGRF